MVPTVVLPNNDFSSPNRTISEAATVPRKELVEDADKHIAVGTRQEMDDEDEDENAPADKEIIVEASNPTLALAAFLTQK